MIKKHVEKVMKSRSEYSYVVISPSDDEYTAVSFSKSGDEHSLDFSLTKTEQIVPIVAFFIERGIEPAEDYVTDEDTENATRHLSYSIEGNAKEVAAICTSILSDVYGIRTDKDLLFSIEK